MMRGEGTRRSCEPRRPTGVRGHRESCWSEDGKEIIVVMKQSQPTTVVSPEVVERRQREARERAWAVIERIGERNADKDPDEVLRDVTEAVEEVRQELYEEKRRAAADRR